MSAEEETWKEVAKGVFVGMWLYAISTAILGVLLAAIVFAVTNRGGSP